MKHIITILLLSMYVSVFAQAEDNIANCEVVVQASVAPDTTDKVEEFAQITTFLPAGDFIFSVFGSDAHITEIESKPIRAVMCTRTSVVPSEFDLKIIRTGIPFYLSSDFDSAGSAFLGVNETEGSYAYSYAGPELSAGETYLLELRMKALNNVEN